jgi:putative addiction module component (TIGR02574 family)
MNTELQRIVEELLALPPTSRVFLAELLAESVDNFADDEVRQAWEVEAERRVRDYEDGNVDVIPGEEVFRQAREKLNEARGLSSSSPERDD